MRKISLPPGFDPRTVPLYRLRYPSPRLERVLVDINWYWQLVIYVSTISICNHVCLFSCDPHCRKHVPSWRLIFLNLSGNLSLSITMFTTAPPPCPSCEPHALRILSPTPVRLRLKCDGTRAETRFRLKRNGRSHLNRRGRQLSRLLAAGVCASAVVMLDTPCSEVV